MTFNKQKYFVTATIAATFFSPLAAAHFQMIIPSNDIVEQGKSKKIDLDIRFWHPFENLGMNMQKPLKVGVMAKGKKEELINTLQEQKQPDATGATFNAYKTTYAFKTPGDHIFYVEPQVYWEPSEETFIVHYAKVIVNAFGLEQGWDTEVGLKSEIVPLTRPYGIWTGNIFQGQVKMNGKPVPYSAVEIEYFNQEGKIKPPAAPFITQLIKADGDGIFTYAMPKAGWWSFAALNQDAKKMQHEGKDYPVEIGAVLWIKATDMK